MAEPMLIEHPQQQAREVNVHVPMRGGTLRINLYARPYRPRGSHPLAAIQCEGEAMALCRQLRQVMETARLAEWGEQERWQIVVNLDRRPAEDERLWELGLVVADRLVRGRLPAGQGSLWVLGGSADWSRGQVSLSHGSAALLHALPNDAQSTVVVAQPEPGTLEARELAHRHGGRWLVIPHLGALLGHPDPSQSARTAKAWFPLVGGVQELAWVEVTVQPCDDCPGTDKGIAVGEAPDGLREQITQVLQAARGIDTDGGSGWRTAVRFSRTNFSDESYQLALVMADRIARGREPQPRGRLIATGRSTQWARGQVETVGGLEEKIALCAMQGAQHDRLLLPADGVTAQATEPLIRHGISVGLLKHLSV